MVQWFIHHNLTDSTLNINFYGLLIFNLLKDNPTIFPSEHILSQWIRPFIPRTVSPKLEQTTELSIIEGYFKEQVETFI